MLASSRIMDNAVMTSGIFFGYRHFSVMLDLTRHPFRYINTSNGSPGKTCEIFFCISRVKHEDD